MFLTNLPKLNSIKIGNIFRKPKKGIERLAANSVRLVVLEDSNYPEYMGFRGSCTLVKNGNNSFIVCTRHQLGVKLGPQPDLRTLQTLRFVSHSDSVFLKNIPTDSCLFVSDHEDEEFHDILIFHVPTEQPDYLPERPNFYPLQKFSFADRHASWIVGYPTELTEFKYDPQSIHSVAHMFDCVFNSSFGSKARNLKQVSYKLDKPSMDGFSGGAVFSFLEGEVGWEIVFDGIIVRAGNGTAYIIDSSFILEMTKNFKSAPKVEN